MVKWCAALTPQQFAKYCISLIKQQNTALYFFIVTYKVVEHAQNKRIHVLTYITAAVTALPQQPIRPFISLPKVKRHQDATCHVPEKLNRALCPYQC